MNDLTFSQTQLDIIRDYLDKKCVGESCVKRADLFTALKSKLKLKNVEPYKFETAITKVIRSNAIPGFQTRSGRSGGICRAGIFKEKDSHKVKPCNITSGIYSMQVNKSEAKLIHFLVNVLKAKQVSSKGTIIVNGKHFISKAKPEEIFVAFLNND